MGGISQPNVSVENIRRAVDILSLNRYVAAAAMRSFAASTAATYVDVRTTDSRPLISCTYKPVRRVLSWNCAVYRGERPV